MEAQGDFQEPLDNEDLDTEGNYSETLETTGAGVKDGPAGT